MPYYTLVSRLTGTKFWAIEFGDYERQCVKDEMDELRYSNQFSDDRMEFKMIRTANDDQDSIDAAVAVLNA